MSAEIEQAIKDAAQEPAKAAGDGHSVEMHPLKDLIAADEHVSAKAAARKTGSLGIRMIKLVPPGTTS